MIKHDVYDDRFPHSKATTQSHNKYHNSDRFAPVSEVVNKTTSTNTIMMIPDILRNLFDIDYLLCPSVLTTTNVTKTADLVSTVNNNNIESTSSIPAQQITNEVFIHTSTTSTTAPTLLNDHSSIIIKPSMHCTPRTIETMMSTDDDNDDDDDYDASDAEHRNVTTTPSNTNRPSFNHSPSAPSTTLWMTVTPSPDSAIQIGVNPTTNSENHAYNGRSAIGVVSSPIPISFPNQDIAHPVLPIDGNRRNIATRLLFFPLQHHKLQRTKTVVSVTSPVDISKPIDSKVERRRRLLRREKHHRKTTTVDVKETPTSTTQMGSQRSTVNEVMLDDTENTDITTTMDDDSIRIISKLRQQLQSMDRQLQSITVLNDSNIDRLSPSNDSNDSTQINLGIVFNQHLESIQHLLTRMQQDMTTIMNPVVTNEYEVDAISVERAMATTSSTTPSIVVNDNVSPSTPSYNMNNFFIRVQDLDIECLPHDVSISSSLSSLSTISTSFHKSSSSLNYDNKFYFHVTSPSKLGMILERLVQYGYRTISQPIDKINSVDNIDFQPTRDTQRLLQQQQKHSVSLDDELNRCYIYTWIGTKDKNRTCNTDIADTFGNTWPITKVRAIIPNVSPLKLITFLFDSAQVPKYNNISLGRDDLMTWHYDQNYENDVSSSNKDSLIGTVKIVRGRVQPKLFPKVIETLCIMYITSIPGELDSYMIVSRSILEDETWGDENAAMILTSPNSNNSTQTATTTIRSEMLLNVYYVRPMKQQGHCCSHSVDGTSCCELTMVTHVVSPGVPEIFAKRMAPTTAMTMVREIQSIFSAK